MTLQTAHINFYTILLYTKKNQVVLLEEYKWNILYTRQMCHIFKDYELFHTKQNTLFFGNQSLLLNI